MSGVSWKEQCRELPQTLHTNKEFHRKRRKSPGENIQMNDGRVYSNGVFLQCDIATFYLYKAFKYFVFN